MSKEDEMNESSAVEPVYADLDAMFGMPIGYSQAIQGLFYGTSSVEEFLAACRKIEADLRAKQMRKEFDEVLAKLPPATTEVWIEGAPVCRREGVRTRRSIRRGHRRVLLPLAAPSKRS